MRADCKMPATVNMQNVKDGDCVTSADRIEKELMAMLAAAGDILVQMTKSTLADATAVLEVELGVESKEATGGN